MATNLHKYRNGHDITYEILELLGNSPQKKTKIMYRCALSWTQTLTYLKELTGKGLIDVSEDEYRLTPKGNAILKLFKEEQVISSE